MLKKKLAAQIILLNKNNNIVPHNELYKKKQSTERLNLNSSKALT